MMFLAIIGMLIPTFFELVHRIRNGQPLFEEVPDPSLEALSLGVAAMIPTLDSTPAELFTLADQALYRAKQEGRNRVQAPTPGWQPTS